MTDRSFLTFPTIEDSLVFLFDPQDDCTSHIQAILRRKFRRLVVFESSETSPERESEVPDIILISVGRVEFSEAAVIRRVREDPATRATPILLLSDSQAESKKRSLAALKLGADDVTFKPFEKTLLLRRIEAHLTLSGLRRSEAQAPIGLAMEQLRWSERRHRAIVSAMGEVMWTTSDSGDAEDPSPMWESITGQSQTEYKNMGWLSAIHPADRRAVQKTWREVLQNEKRLVVEFRLKRRDGEYCYMRAKGVPLKNSLGRIIEWAGTISDISEGRQAEEKLRLLNEDLERRIEVRTEALLESRNRLRLLIVELNRVEQMERQKIAADLHDNQAQLLVVARLALAQGIKQLERDMPVPSPFLQLQNLITETLESTRNLMTDLSPPGALEHDDLIVTLRWIVEKLGKNGLSVELSSSRRQIPLNRDLLLIIFQSVRELLSNTVKYAGTGKASIHVRCSGDKVHVEIADEGMGFDVSEKMEKPSGGGFGLLNIRERILGMGGIFQIESSPQRGTRANITFPLDKSETHFLGGVTSGSSRLSDGAVPRMKFRNAKTSVLLVDDHCMIRQGLRRIIEEKGDLFVVGESADGLDALNQAQKLQPDVVLMDINMPRMNGLEATRRLHSLMPDLTIIGLSLHCHDSMAGGMMEAGAVAYVSKEEASETLCATIRREVDKKGSFVSQ